MIDFPLDGLLDEQACLHWLEQHLHWLEQHLHPKGLRCPRCQSQKRRMACRRVIPAYRCRDCDRYYTALTGTAFEKTRQLPSKIVLMLRGVAKGEPTARLSRELAMSRKQMHTLRHRIQTHLYENRRTCTKRCSGKF